MREHMGVWTGESGRWQRSGDAITFSPKDRGKPPYRGAEVAHRGRKFLAFETETALGLVIPIDDTKRQLDLKPTALPPYVFFEIDKATYEREIKQTYPFRTRRHA